MPLVQRGAAVPNYLQGRFDEAAPGHRFLMYLGHWQRGPVASFAPYRKQSPRDADERAAFARESAAVLGEACAIPASVLALSRALVERQRGLLTQPGANGHSIRTTSTAPFATGLGNEHPTENGFAFLTPYGLPYLAGSGVKGVLRRAAEELTLENDGTETDTGWTWLDVWWLFGFEGAVDQGSIWDDSSPLGQTFRHDLDRLAARPELDALLERLAAADRSLLPCRDRAQDGPRAFVQRLIADKSFRGGLQFRGALDCWDVFPQPANGRLAVEIMTPHYGKYYRGEEPPHDAGTPVPVTFLAVPAGSQFDFHLRCDETRLPEPLRARWRDLLDQAVSHAFAWLGFGAKTSVGYGAMAPPPARAAAAPVAPSEATEVWPAAMLTWNAGTDEVKATFAGKSTSVGLKSSELTAALGAERSDRLRKKKELKHIAVEVERQGNKIRLVGLAAS